MRTAPFSYVDISAPPCPVRWANARGAAAIAVATAPVVSKVRLTLSIIGALLDDCHGRCGSNSAGKLSAMIRTNLVVRPSAANRKGVEHARAASCREAHAAL